jgi:hypothetical protein
VPVGVKARRKPAQLNNRPRVQQQLHIGLQQTTRMEAAYGSPRPAVVPASGSPRITSAKLAQRVYGNAHAGVVLPAPAAPRRFHIVEGSVGDGSSPQRLGAAPTGAKQGVCCWTSDPLSVIISLYERVVRDVARSSPVGLLWGVWPLLEGQGGWLSTPHFVTATFF